MRFLRRSPLVGAYLCPRGVFLVQCKRRGAAIEIQRAFDIPSPIESAEEGADQLVRALRSAGIQQAEIAIAVRGFGVTHHVLQMPPAKDELLRPVIDREVRRLEPQLGDAVVDWTILPSTSPTAEGVALQQVLVAAAPSDTIQALADRMGAEGYRIAHLTALPAAMQRLVEEFDAGSGTTALVAALPDGAFIGFAMDGALRLIIEPPLPPHLEHDPSALAEELELGAMFVRQQFRGAEINRVALVGTRVSLHDAETVLANKLHVPVQYIGVRELSPSAYAALGAVLDQQSARPVSLGGHSLGRGSASRSMLDSVSVAAVFVLAMMGAWTVFQTVMARQAAAELRTAQQRIENDSFGLAPIRATADQRRLARDAMTAVLAVQSDRGALQEALVGLSESVRPPVRFDSLHLMRNETGWKTVIVGMVQGPTTASAIEALHDTYRDIPQRITLDSLNLNQLLYAESPGVERAVVRFQLSFDILTKKKD